MSVGNLTPGISKGYRTLHSWPNSSGIPPANTYGSDGLLSAESSPSLVGSFICPSETCCTHVHGLQIAVTVGLEGDPLGRKVLGLLVSPSVVSVSVIGVEETTGIIMCSAFPPETSVAISAGKLVVVLFCPLTIAKNYLVEVIASS